jgi:protein TonB
MPEFPGGLAALKEFVRVNLQYPQAALEKGIEGRVYVNFMVAKTGAVSDVKVAKSIDPLLDKEAARIVKSMPTWNPGKQHGDAVEVSYTLPIDFRLPKKK